MVDIGFLKKDEDQESRFENKSLKDGIIEEKANWAQKSGGSITAFYNDNKENTKPDTFRKEISLIGNRDTEDINKKVLHQKRKRNEQQAPQRVKNNNKKKMCEVCSKTVGSRGNSLIECKQCGSFYHFLCHTPQILEKPKKRKEWKCADCCLHLGLKMKEVTRPSSTQIPNNLEVGSFYVKFWILINKEFF